MAVFLGRRGQDDDWNLMALCLPPPPPSRTNCLRPRISDGMMCTLVLILELELELTELWLIQEPVWPLDTRTRVKGRALFGFLNGMENPNDPDSKPGCNSPAGNDSIPVTRGEHSSWLTPNDSDSPPNQSTSISKGQSSNHIICHTFQFPFL